MVRRKTGSKKKRVAKNQAVRSTTTATNYLPQVTAWQRVKQTYTENPITVLTGLVALGTTVVNLCKAVFEAVSQFPL